MATETSNLSDIGTIDIYRKVTRIAAGAGALARCRASVVLAGLAFLDYQRMLTRLGLQVFRMCSNAAPLIRWTAKVLSEDIASRLDLSSAQEWSSCYMSARYHGNTKKSLGVRLIKHIYLLNIEAVDYLA